MKECLHQAALIYGCPFCGVRFSSPRTLQGHLSYYCSKKKAQHIVSPRSRTRPPSDCQSTTGYTTDITTVKLEADCTDATKTSSSSQQQAADTNSSSSSSSSSSNSSSNSRSSSSGGGRGVKRLASVSDNSSGSNEDTSPPPPKAGRVDGGSPAAHHCPLCSYRTDKTASLTRHMRIHNRPPDPEVKAGGEGRVSAVGGQSGSGGVLCSAATFCKECNIQFSSLSTFQCHKKHYCSQRNIGRLADRTADSPQFGMAAVPPLGLGGGMSAASLGLASLGQNGLLFPAAHPLPSADTAGALPVTAAIMPNGQPAVILTAPVMTPTGITSMAIPLSTVLQSTAVLQSIQAAAAAARVSTPLSPPVSATSPQKSSSPAKLDASPRSSVPEEAHQSKSPKRAYSSEAGSSKDLPLDLSTKKPDTDVSGPPDRKIKKEKEEDGSPGAPTTSGSSPRRSNSTEGFPGGSAATATTTSTTTSSTPTPTPTPLPALPPHLLTSSLLQPFLPLTGMAVPVKPPAHIFGAGMPPGSSKCMDCNIIFYKHENYLAHKQHYCSERKKLRPVGAGSSAAALSPRVSESVGVKVEPSSTVAVATPESGKQSPVRTVSPDKDDEPSSISQPVFATSTSLKPPPLVPTPSANTPEVYYKFFCVPCKIKFSSASNLKAHKDYYCPHGKNSEHSIIAHRVGGEIIPTGGASVEQQASPGSSESSPSPGQYGCPQCRGTFTSSRLLKLHLCSAEVAQASVLKCSHCDYLTHTDKRLAEHMKVHNPTSAYRCTLCGYRGNTVRGMRMHGKTHTDNGEDFTDDHMIEFQEPPLVPIQTNSDLKAAQGPFSVEAELLRLKNEPYKRRRSRKAYEKVDLLVSLDDPQTCHLCGECLPDHPTLVDHLRQHLREHQQSIGDHLLLPCPHCGVVTSTQHLAAHMDLAHGSPVPREEKENHPQTPTCPHSPPPQRFESSSLEKRSPVRVKEEPLDSDCENRDSEGQRNTESEPAVDALPTDGGEDSAEEGSPSVGRPDSEVNSASQEVDVERSVGQEGSPGVCVKSEPELDRDDDSYNDPPLPITFATASPSSSPQPATPSSLPSSPHHRVLRDSPPSLNITGPSLDSSAHLMPVSTPTHIKVEPDLLAHSPGHAIFPRFFIPTVRSPLVMAAPSVQDRSGRSGESSGAPYCKNCDISFTYHSTFIAHKKYYCTERNTVPHSATA